MEKYLKNLDSIDAAYYAAVNRKMGLAKVIILPLDNIGNVHLGFTEQEFEELKCIIRSYISGGSRSQSETAALHNFGKRQKVCVN
jgi:hypothetical protein